MPCVYRAPAAALERASKRAQAQGRTRTLGSLSGTDSWPSAHRPGWFPRQILLGMGSIFLQEASSSRQASDALPDLVIRRPESSGDVEGTAPKLRILCLHGHHSSPKYMAQGLQQLHQRFAGRVQFECLEGPHEAHDAWGGRSWIATDNGEADDGSEVKWSSTLALVKRAILAHGPYDGLWGYSMGAATSSLLVAALPPGTFRFAVLAAGYKTAKQPKLLALLADATPIRTPTLHIHGQSDGIILPEWSRYLMDHFDEGTRELCTHPGEHLAVPKTDAGLRQVELFLSRQVDGGSVGAGSTSSVTQE